MTQTLSKHEIDALLGSLSTATGEEAIAENGGNEVSDILIPLQNFEAGGDAYEGMVLCKENLRTGEKYDVNAVEVWGRFDKECKDVKTQKLMMPIQDFHELADGLKKFSDFLKQKEIPIGGVIKNTQGV